MLLGLDIGSISINTVLMDEQGRILENHYTLCHGRPFAVLLKILENLRSRHGDDGIALAAATGTGGKLAANLIGGRFVNEIVAQSAAAARLYPQARTIIEMGGEDSKLIFMEQKDGRSRLADFAMNTICAAGTGSFLDQQARRIGVSIDGEFGELALKSSNPPRIAGRCSVFAKSDMIHLQQIATPVEDIVAGLCFAVARNFKSSLTRGKRPARPFLFQGGVAANAGMVRAFREIFELADEELIVPEYHASMGAIGAVFYLLSHPAAPSSAQNRDRYRGAAGLADYLKQESSDEDHLERLRPSASAGDKSIRPLESGVLDVYLGLDVGSLSTNVVLIDADHRVVARRYLPTAGRPLEAIRRGLEEIRTEVGGRVRVRGAGTTGSGRYLTGDFIGADTVRNEITAQATAAIDIDPRVDTIFEIGGQDSKFISIDNGVIVDFEMNKVCAAGTGSFLEEQAEKLDINIEEEFGELALNAPAPARLGDRCTVFMESDLNAHQQKGVSKENLVGGLAYSIVQNYLQKVVGTKRVGRHIFFQGGVTNNRAVVAAFEKVTGQAITVPPHFDVTGAIGAAILAKEAVTATPGKTTRFKGFDISRTKYTLDRYTCRRCPNQCEIRRVKIEGETRPLRYGDRCGRFDALRDGGGTAGNRGLPNLFGERLTMLLGDYREDAGSGRPSIGLPRGLMLFYQQFPFWRTFFETLGLQVVLSSPSNRRLVTRSLEMLVAETCFPVEVMHGHVLDLFDREVDRVFLPFIVNARAGEDNPTFNFNCPWIQTYPFMIRGAMRGDPREEKLLIPDLHFLFGRRVLEPRLRAFAGSALGIPARAVSRALEAAEQAQDAFEAAVRRRGRELLGSLPRADSRETLVILGRPYNTGDPELNLNLVEKFLSLGVLPVPTDFLPLEQENIFPEYPMMYWPNGSRILAAARIIARTPWLHAVYLGNFRCGPDSFLLHYVREEMKGKPFLQLEVDEHSADAGMITRCEAYLDSLRGTRRGAHAVDCVADCAVDCATPTAPPAPGVPAPPSTSAAGRISRRSPAAPGNGRGLDGRTLYFPYMCDSAYLTAAAVRGCGLDSEALPMQNERDLELARRHTSSRECFPMICTLGSFLRKMEEPGFDPGRTAFFMPGHGGPCRFGQYRMLQRIIFDRLGYRDVRIISPTNENAYREISVRNNTRLRMLMWYALVTGDLLRKLLQEYKPYEARPGAVREVYERCLREAVACLEQGGQGLREVMREAARAFQRVPRLAQPRKPVIAVVGEIFMRDNPFCSGFVVDHLEALGGETIIAPIREWIAFATYRYARESAWRGSLKGMLRARIMEAAQNLLAARLDRAVAPAVEMERSISMETMLELCDPYVHHHYVGDPPIALGAAAALSKTGISGVANILPFTCMPGTLITSVSDVFRREHNHLPWVNISFDGQQDTGIETRLQAFMHQAREYTRRHGLDRPRDWG